ncbi:MAG: hypothetical protein V4726_01450 [Verrucomicrobiota bacterium]
MKFTMLRLLALAGLLSSVKLSPACEIKLNNDPALAKSPSLKIKNVSVEYKADLDVMVFSMDLEGEAGKTTPKAAGQLDGAPVLAYVFPTSLKAADVGMGKAEGIVALAITSHPDFDDTPLWDENANGDYNDDKKIWHTHWALLVKDDRVPGGLSVKEFKKGDKKVVLPPTNCGMPMYLDAAGHSVVERGNTIRAVVPAYFLHHKTKFSFDGVACYMQVNTSCMSRPMLGVYEVYSVASKDLSLPYKTK